MQTHKDGDFQVREALTSPFMKRLQARAEAMRAAGESQITGGEPGEKPLREWQHNGIQVRHMPDDEQAILRISVGGRTNTHDQVNYCVYRGNVAACIGLLEDALTALRHGAEPHEGGDE